MLITIGGLPGSGTTTVAKLLAKKLNISHMDAGDLWDLMAKEKGTDVLGLNLLAEKDSNIDHELDEKLVETARKSTNAIMESRLIGYFCHNKDIPAFKIWLSADTEIRINRLKKAERSSEKVVVREKSEKKRYLELYNIDIDQLSVYDLVVNTNELTPEKIVEHISSSISTQG